MPNQRFVRHPDCQIHTAARHLQSCEQMKAVERLVMAGHSIDMRALDLSADDPSGQFVYCQSSGSTDKAKTICRSAASWIASFNENANRFELVSKDRYALLGTLGHSLTLYGTLEAMHVGADLHFLCDTAPRSQLTSLQTKEVSVLYATPSQLRLLLSSLGETETRLEAMRLIFSGGGKLDPACWHAMAMLCPNARIFEFYGASETSFITLWDDTTPQGSVGRPYPGVCLSIRDPQGMETAGIGEIWVKSPYLFNRYAEGTSADTRWQGDFLTVGEFGVLDPNGYLFLKGRKSRMITVADNNVFLEDIEAVLLAEPDIVHAAALARADTMRGSVVVGIVQARESEALRKQLIARCRENLAPHSVPKHIHFCSQMPLLPAGKPDLVTLARDIEALI